MLIFRQKSFYFCTPRLKTPLPVLPYCRGCQCVTILLNHYAFKVFSNMNGSLKPNLLSNIKYFKSTFEDLGSFSSIWKEKVLALIPIPKLNLGFSSRYKNVVSISHYNMYLVKNQSISQVCITIRQKVSDWVCC